MEFQYLRASKIEPVSTTKTCSSRYEWTRYCDYGKKSSLKFWIALNMNQGVICQGKGYEHPPVASKVAYKLEGFRTDSTAAKASVMRHLPGVMTKNITIFRLTDGAESLSNDWPGRCAHYNDHSSQSSGEPMLSSGIDDWVWPKGRSEGSNQNIPTAFLYDSVRGRFVK